MNCIFFLFFVCLFAAAEFIGAGLNGMAFFSTYDTDPTKFVMKQTKEIDEAGEESDNLHRLIQAGIHTVVQPRAHFVGSCVQSTGVTGGPVTFAVRLCLYIDRLSL